MLNILKGTIRDNNNSDSEDEKYSSNSDQKYFSDNNLKLFNNLYNEINNSLCLIKANKNYGTGFFIEIPVPSKENPMRGIMTNNHVLNETQLKLGESFKIFMANNQEQGIEIQINDEDFVFTSELIDITFVELSIKYINEIEPVFLKPSSKDAIINEPIIIFQYPKTQYSVAFGNIKDIHSFDYYHEISTDRGSSGSPLLNTKYEVVGIHKSSRTVKNKDKKDVYVNVAVKFSEIDFAIKILYYNKNIYGIERAKSSTLKLNTFQKKKLNEYGLCKRLSSSDVDMLRKDIENIENENERKKKLEDLKILKKSLFYCNFSEKLLFYRTNYAWYITLLSKGRLNYIPDQQYTMENIKKLDWSPIISNVEFINENIEEEIKKNFGRAYILITWLKLTELKYL
jgi:hypothetical protein